MKVREDLSMRFGQRWMMIVMMATHCPAGAQPTVNPNDRAQPTPQLNQRLALESFNPTLRKAVGDADHAACLLSLWYNGEGTIQAVQLISTSGFPAIDQACFAAVIGQKLKPPALIQPELGGWVRLPINWVFGRKPDSGAPPPPAPDPSIPALRLGDPLDLLPPYYPEAALARHESGVCKMHVTVSPAGDVDAIEISQSTGSAELDRACFDAIYDAPFLPATRDGKPVMGTTDVVLLWRLPSPAS